MPINRQGVRKKKAKKIPETEVFVTFKSLLPLGMVHPLAVEKALAISGGNVKRLRAINSTTIVVVN